MANHNYSYNPSGYAGGGATATATALYPSRSLYGAYLSTDASLRGSAFRYLSADSLSAAAFSSSAFYNPSNYSVKLSGLYATTTEKAFASPGVDLGSRKEPFYAGLKRTSTDSLYHQLGTDKTIGQTEGWYSTNLLAKRPRYESTSQLPTYPQRPGEKDCAHYMQTRTCKFGESCKFDHPIWVPGGGIPDWKEIPHAPDESHPNRPGEPDCPYFLKTKRCKFGTWCKFNHPKEVTVTQSATGDTNPYNLPERPSEPPCAFYMKTGNCKFGSTCKFHHPKGIDVSSARDENGSMLQYRISRDAKPVQPLYGPAFLYNTKGLPIRPDIEDCPFYLKTGSCKYGTTCRYNHPERNAIKSLTAVIAPSRLTSPSSHFDFGIGPSMGSLLPRVDSKLTQTQLGFGQFVFPQRPGQLECDFYMKHGTCKFGENCKFHHPVDRATMMFTLAGLPRRQGATNCPYYMKTGICKFGATCKFDHPPPGEVIAISTCVAQKESLEEV